jgi:hypothetical protein
MNLDAVATICAELEHTTPACRPFAPKPRNLPESADQVAPLTLDANLIGDHDHAKTEIGCQDMR